MKISDVNKNRIVDFLKEGKRFDERELLEYRDIKIETEISKNAEGSARVNFGDTEVVVGVKIDVTEPYTDHEDEGTLITSAELLPLSSPKYETGPPRIDAIELARIVDRGIRESGFIDFKKLCIKKGEKVYGIFLDLYSINDDGNLIDACALGAVAALKSAKMPKYDEKEEKVKYGEFTSKSLPLTKKVPCTITFYKIGDNIIIDPVIGEEESAEGRISIALTNEKEMRINAMQKGDMKTFTEEEVLKIIDLAVGKFKDLEKQISKVK